MLLKDTRVPTEDPQKEPLLALDPEASTLNQLEHAEKGGDSIGGHIGPKIVESFM